MERIKSEKFKQLGKTQTRLVIGGGTKTEARSFRTGIVERYQRDGRWYQRAQVKSYSGDEVDGRDTCYDNLETCWDVEEPYFPQ